MKSYLTAPSCGLFQKHVKVRVKTFCRVEVGMGWWRGLPPHCYILSCKPADCLLYIIQVSSRVRQNVLIVDDNTILWRAVPNSFFSRAALIGRAALSAAILGFNFNVIQIRKHSCLQIQANSSFKNSLITHIYCFTLLLPATLCMGLHSSGLK